MIERIKEFLKRLGSLVAETRACARPASTALQGLRAAPGRFLACKRARKTLGKAGLIVLGIAAALALAFFAFRNTVLRSVIDGRLRSFAKSNHGITVTVNAARFRGLAVVELERVRLRSGGDVVELGKLSVTASFWRLFLGNVRLRNLELIDLRVDLGRAPAPTTAKAPERPATPSPAATISPATKTASENRAPDYGARVARLLDLYFDRIPDSMVIERIFIHSTFADARQALYIPRLAVDGPAFTTSLEVFDQGKKWSCALSGGVDRKTKRFNLHLKPSGALAVVPFLQRQWGLKFGFDTLDVSLQSRGRRDRVLRLEGSLAIAGLAINQPRIAADDVRLDNAAVDFSLRVGPNFVELAAPSRVAFNRMTFQPTLKLVSHPTRKIELKVPETRFSADDLFASLPAGLFTRLAGIRCSGELVFHLDFAIDLSRPEELELDVDLKKSGFRIHRFGNADFRHFANPFLYTAYDGDRALRSFVVGPGNPDFVPLGDIPDFLKYSVLISEDGAFFSHNGFLLEPFKDSIAANLKAGRFVRGASTISMQLVKNLYLRRQKTIARKLEELLITWLIEANRLVSKERMLETYLNIIEWGPGVYGAREAARFYFAREPAALTLAEAIFMAAIIPRPKRFAGFFGDDGRLRPWLQGYFIDVSRKMLARGWISPFDYDTLLPEVTLTGPARMLLRGYPSEPVAPEELLMGDEADIGDVSGNEEPR